MIELQADLAMAAMPQHGEGPLWDDRTQRLWWVDIIGCAVHALDHATLVDTVIPLDQQVGAVALRAGGGLLVTAERGIALWDAAMVEALVDRPEPVALLVVVPVDVGPEDVRFNDGASDPHGRWWGGTMHRHATPGVGRLHRVDVDHTSRVVATGLDISNGMAWARDGATAWLADSGVGTIDRLDVDPESGDLLARHPFLDWSDMDGVPDGITIDTDGCLWAAMYGAGEVRRITPAGVVDLVVRVPVDKPTSCGFAGPNLDELWITSTHEGLDPSQRRAQPHAGSLFVCRPGATGWPTDRYAG